MDVKIIGAQPLEAIFSYRLKQRNQRLEDGIDHPKDDHYHDQGWEVREFHAQKDIGGDGEAAEDEARED